MILGSHDTMTYLTPKKWYWRPLVWTARCQKNSIYKQYENGARMFDLRIRFDKDGYPEFAHGPIVFKGTTPQYVLEFLNALQEKIYVRIMLESNFKMKDQDRQEALFKRFCEDYSKNTKLYFFGGNRKYDGKVIYDFGNQYPSIEGKYSSVTGTVLDDIWPWLYAKTHNKKTLKKGTDKDILMIDFI